MTEATTYTSTDTPVHTELSGRPAAEDPETPQEHEKSEDDGEGDSPSGHADPRQ